MAWLGHTANRELARFVREVSTSGLQVDTGQRGGLLQSRFLELSYRGF